jgi:chemotaxis protein CheZ
LLSVLLDNIAPERREQFAASAAALTAGSLAGSAGSLLNGPTIKAEGGPDVMKDQSQVDDLLASLGF